MTGLTGVLDAAVVIGLAKGDVFPHLASLYSALSIPRAVRDDRDLIREAARHGLTTLRTPDLVLLMKARGLLPSVQPILDRMVQRGYGIAPDLYERALRAAGEWPNP